jgi:hypothetical protein
MIREREQHARIHSGSGNVGEPAGLEFTTAVTADAASRG